MAAGWYNAAWAAGAVVMGLVAAGKLRAMKISTIPEFFEKYYDTKGRVISAVGLVIIMSVITALQYLAGGAILASLLPDIFSNAHCRSRTDRKPRNIDRDQAGT